MVQTVLPLAAVCLTVLALALVLIRNRAALAAVALALALLDTALLEAFDSLAVANPGDLLVWKKCGLIAEGFLPPLWLLATALWGRGTTWREVGWPWRLLLLLSLAFPAMAVLAPAQAFFFSPDFASERILFLEVPAFAFSIGLMVFLTLALVNLEATLSRATHGWRWKIKFEILGLGMLLAAMVFYYSQALLYRTQDMNLLPVRSLALAAASLLLGYSQLRRQGAVRMTLSRHMAYKSVVLFAVGSYLIVLGLFGEGMKHLGESFGRSLWIALAFLMGAGLLVVFLSETVKRKIQGFLARHFYEQKYDYRLHWIDFTTRISQARTRDELHQAILTAFCDTFGIGCAALFLKDFHQGSFQPAAFMEMDPSPVVFRTGDELPRLLSDRPDILELRDTAALPLAPEQSALFTTNAVLFVIPLLLNNVLDGFIVLGRPVNPSEEYSGEDQELMRVMARQAASALLNLRLADQLAQARDMESLGKVSAFVAHDIKNHVYTLSLMVENAREYIADPEFQADMLASLTGTIGRMKILIAQLKTLPEKRTLKKTRVDLLELAREAAAMLPAEGVIRVQGGFLPALADREELHKVFLNLLLNAFEAVDGHGSVEVTGQRADGWLGIRVADTGCGMAEDFLRHQLFQPFKTTKAKGMGIGLYQSKQIVEAHGGRIEVDSQPGQGSTFTVWLPSEGEENA